MLTREFMYRTIICKTAHDFVLADRVLNDYAAWLGIDLTFQDFSKEKAELDQMYGGEKGCYLLLQDDSCALAGGVGLRAKSASICEMKRLYIYPDHQGKGLGRRLCAELLVQARKKGYSAMRLDTLPDMTAALAVYRELGFYEIGNYNNNPYPESIFLEVDLKAQSRWP